MKRITDVLGNEVREGDTLAVATAGYRHKPELRVGQVQGFYTRRSNDTGTPDQIEVFWDAGSGMGHHMVGTVSRIDATLKRFVVLPRTAE